MPWFVGSLNLVLFVPAPLPALTLTFRLIPASASSHKHISFAGRFLFFLPLLRDSSSFFQRYLTTLTSYLAPTAHFSNLPTTNVRNHDPTILVCGDPPKHNVGSEQRHRRSPRSTAQLRQAVARRNRQERRASQQS
jgi:hypothetical protein